MIFLKFPEDNVTNQDGYSDFLLNWLTEEFDRDYDIPSSGTNPGYTCNPYRKTCNCDYIANYLPEKIDYIAYGSHSELDIRLFCRHMAKAVLPSHPKVWDSFDFSNIDVSNIQQGLLNVPFRELRYRRETLLLTEVILGYDIDNHWISLYLPDEKYGCSRYRFNLLNNEWAYGEGPTGYARAARNLFKELFDRKGSGDPTMFEDEIHQMDLAIEEFPDQAARYEHMKGVFSQLISTGKEYGLLKWYEIEKNGKLEINLLLADD